MAVTTIAMWTKPMVTAHPAVAREHQFVCGVGGLTVNKPKNLAKSHPFVSELGWLVGEVL